MSTEPKEEFLISAKDLAFIVAQAKTEYVHLPGDLHISNQKVEEKDFKHISLANAVIMWLNSKGLLNKLVKFDYTDQSSQYEETDE
jgi:hypothetical protein